MTMKKKIAMIVLAHTVENLESDSSNLEIYSVANRKPMPLRENRRDVAKTRFFSNDPGKCILNKLSASQV